MNVVVYLGSGESKREIFRQAARELGAWIGRNGHTLISAVRTFSRYGCVDQG